MDNIYDDLMDFLERSSNRYSYDITNAKKALLTYSGDFWTDEVRKKYKRTKKRMCLSMNNWNVIVNAIFSKFSKSPWHIHIDADRPDVQDKIDSFEMDNDNKSAILEAFRMAVITGFGYIAITTDEKNGQLAPVLEYEKDLSSVAFDPDADDVAGKDAEEGAILDFISKRRAKRLYDIDFTHIDSKSLATKFEQWCDHADEVPVIHYFVKNERGTVDVHKYVGNINVDEFELNISRIPIVRFAGIDKFDNDNFTYKGIIEDTFYLMLGVNIAYSTLIERCNRSPKANFIANVDAIDGLENYYAQAGDEDSALVLYKGEHMPVSITEQFQTADLTNMIDSCRNLIQDVSGIPLTGIVDDKTATEILQQEANRESNQSVFYNHAFMACKLIGEILVDMFSDEKLPFKLLNGPDSITANMERRSEIQYISQFVPDNVKPILATFATDTIASEVGADMKRNIIANLPTDIKYIANERIDAAAIHQMNQQQELLEQSQATINELQQQILALTKEKEDYYRQLMEGREQRELDWQKFKISSQLDIAKNEADNAIAAKKLELETAKAINRAEVDRMKTIAETDRVLEGEAQ